MGLTKSSLLKPPIILKTQPLHMPVSLNPFLDCRECNGHGVKRYAVSFADRATRLEGQPVEPAICHYCWGKGIPPIPPFELGIANYDV